eukprot:gene32980-39885_t
MVVHTVLDGCSEEGIGGSLSSPQAEAPASLSENLILEQIISKISSYSQFEKDWNASHLAVEIMGVLSSHTSSSQVEIDAKLNETYYKLQSEHNATLRQLEGLEIQLNIARHEITVQKLKNEQARLQVEYANFECSEKMRRLERDSLKACKQSEQPSAATRTSGAQEESSWKAWLDSLFPPPRLESAPETVAPSPSDMNDEEDEEDDGLPPSLSTQLVHTAQGALKWVWQQIGGMLRAIFSDDSTTAASPIPSPITERGVLDGSPPLTQQAQQAHQPATQQETSMPASPPPVPTQELWEWVEEAWSRAEELFYTILYALWRFVDDLLDLLPSFSDAPIPLPQPLRSLLADAQAVLGDIWGLWLWGVEVDAVWWGIAEAEPRLSVVKLLLVGAVGAVGIYVLMRHMGTLGRVVGGLCLLPLLVISLPLLLVVYLLAKLCSVVTGKKTVKKTVKRKKGDEGKKVE